VLALTLPLHASNSCLQSLHGAIRDGSGHRLASSNHVHFEGLLRRLPHSALDGGLAQPLVRFKPVGGRCGAGWWDRMELVADVPAPLRKPPHMHQRLHFEKMVLVKGASCRVLDPPVAPREAIKLAIYLQHIDL